MNTNTSGASAVNVIGSGTELVGDLFSSGDVRIDGKLRGAVKTQGKLVVGEQGFIEGAISCKNAEIAGTVKATVVVEGLLSLHRSARLEGEIEINKLAIEPGAKFSGTCKMGQVAAAQASVKKAMPGKRLAEAQASAFKKKDERAKEGKQL